MNYELATIATNLMMILVSAFLASYLTYVFAIKRVLRETLLTERVALYRPLIHALSSIIENPSPERLKEIKKELNRISHELLLYAPDNIYRSFERAMKSVKKDESAKPLIEFMITLRKELLNETQITSKDPFEIELKP